MLVLNKSSQATQTNVFCAEEILVWSRQVSKIYLVPCLPRFDPAPLKTTKYFGSTSSSLLSFSNLKLIVMTFIIWKKWG
jgi:hypothetical protein